MAAFEWVNFADPNVFRRIFQNITYIYFKFQITLDSNFYNDCGLDSLDFVEITMALETEFGFEIPDYHAEYLDTPRKFIQYVCDHEDIYE